ncbi:glycosyltransferase family 9 protein [Rhizomonospora bruguierae]|uniref:glycosyltransferase family 9 protein n=1 Tax=Rhizomonospora bruguierae TaxID=1581705 RepID=UPI001BCF273B|nr:glycosyltransferase family 9 protein [Micromonospora sp. NBRC 107566]
MTLEHPAALASPPIRWRDLRAILLIRTDNLGDVVLAGPALRALRRAAPSARLDLLAAPAGAPAAQLLPEVDGVIAASVSWQQTGPVTGPPADDRRLAERIAAGAYDAAVVLTSFSQTPWPAGYLCREAGVPIRVGTSKEFGGAGLTHWVPAPPDPLHQVDRNLYLLERVGAPATGRHLRLSIPAGATAAAGRALRARGADPARPYALILPGASCPARSYPPDRYAEVAALLAAPARGPGLPVVVAGTAREAGLVNRVAKPAGAVAVAGDLDVPALAAAIAGAAVVICNNSGGAHLADAVDTPVVVLFAGTEEVEQYRPRGTAATVLTIPTGCAPCRQFACPYAQDCLAVPPERVAAQAARVATGRRHPGVSGAVPGPISGSKASRRVRVGPGSVPDVLGATLADTGYRRARPPARPPSGRKAQP